MTTRLDVSNVPLQGGYIAKQCPVKIQWEIIEPAERAPKPEMLQVRLDEGIDFEDELIGSLDLSADGPWVLVPPDLPAADATRVTVEAMERGAEVIFGGWLPIDDAGRRVGKPDLLVLADDGYVPVDIKHHLTLFESPEGTALVSEVAEPAPRHAQPRSGLELRKHRGDALQLAHYRRMLEACGHAASSSLAGIIGKEGVIVWYDLDEPMWTTPAKSDGKKRKQRTSMEIYDFEFGFRLDIAATAQQHQNDPSVDLLVVPLFNAECGDCDWRKHCGPIYRAGSGDPTLLPGVHYPQWVMLQAAGVTDRAGVAALDYPTARLAADGVDVAKVLALASATDPATPVDELLSRTPKQRHLVTEAGIVTAGDAIARLDPTTASIGGGFLPWAILNARAVLGPEPIYRLPGAEVTVPRFDIEIDLDMENSLTGRVYLWGALITDRSNTGLADPGYRPFVTWDEDDPEETERRLLTDLVDWLTGLTGAAHAQGRTVGVFVWTATEATQMRRIAEPDPDLSERVDALVTSPAWVDLYEVYKAGWTTGEGASLKPVATAVGYTWPVDDPSGDVSMARHRDAAAGDDQARTWLLDYNRGDVEATKAVRNWTTDRGEAVPHASDVDPTLLRRLGP